VRDGDCQLLDRTFVDINSWDEIIPVGEEFCQTVMNYVENEKLDEVYWEYEEYK
jgi:hypothetical protein